MPLTDKTLSPTFKRPSAAAGPFSAILLINIPYDKYIYIVNEGILKSIIKDMNIRVVK